MTIPPGWNKHFFLLHRPVFSGSSEKSVFLAETLQTFRKVLSYRRPIWEARLNRDSLEVRLREAKRRLRHAVYFDRTLAEKASNDLCWLIHRGEFETMLNDHE